jgi:6-phosphogluconolactonase
MSLARDARPSMVGHRHIRPPYARPFRTAAIAIIVVSLAALFLSCSGNGKLPKLGTGNNAYLTLPNNGSVLLLHTDGVTGALAIVAETPEVDGTSPLGLALAPSKKFLYVANSLSDTISTFAIAGDGTLSLLTTTPDGSNGPNEALIDPSGNYLLVTNNVTTSNGTTGAVSVLSIDSSSGALTPVAGSPFYCNDSADSILIPPTDNFVYVTNPHSGSVSAFTFDPSTGAMSQVTGSPYFSGLGASALAIDTSGQFDYVANTSAPNPLLPNVTGNISGFAINSASGGLTPIPGSPFAPAIGNGPSTLVTDPTSSDGLLLATTPGSSYSVWTFFINPANGQLTVGSEYSASAGGVFALVDTNGHYLYIGSEESNGVAAYTFDSNSGQPTAVLHSPFPMGALPGRMVIVP